MKGTPWCPVPDETWKEDGYAEESENIDDCFNLEIDIEQDEEFVRKFAGEDEKRKQKEGPVGRFRPRDAGAAKVTGYPISESERLGAASTAC